MLCPDLRRPRSGPLSSADRSAGRRAAPRHPSPRSAWRARAPHMDAGRRRARRCGRTASSRASRRGASPCSMTTASRCARTRPPARRPTAGARCRRRHRRCPRRTPVLRPAPSACAVGLSWCWVWLHEEAPQVLPFEAEIPYDTFVVRIKPGDVRSVRPSPPVSCGRAPVPVRVCASGRAPAVRACVRARVRVVGVYATLGGWCAQLQMRDLFLRALSSDCHTADTGNRASHRRNRRRAPTARDASCPRRHPSQRSLAGARGSRAERA